MFEKSFKAWENIFYRWENGKEITQEEREFMIKGIRYFMWLYVESNREFEEMLAVTVNASPKSEPNENLTLKLGEPDDGEPVGDVSELANTIEKLVTPIVDRRLGLR